MAEESKKNINNCGDSGTKNSKIWFSQSDEEYSEEIIKKLIEDFNSSKISEDAEQFISNYSQDDSDEFIKGIIKEVHESVEDIVEDFEGGLEGSVVEYDEDEDFEYYATKDFIEETLSKNEAYSHEKDGQENIYSDYGSDDEDFFDNLEPTRIKGNSFYGFSGSSWQDENEKNLLELKNIIIEDMLELDENHDFTLDLGLKHKDLLDY